MRLLILGNAGPVISLIKSLQSPEIRIVGVSQDRPLEDARQREFIHDLLTLNVTLIEQESGLPDFDLAFVINYNKIINLSQFLGKKMINLHMGLLPKYRGNNANAWAVINGERTVGYTIHEITDRLDAGDIYYKFEYDIAGDATYLNAKKAIESDIALKIEGVIRSIYDNLLAPQSQSESEFVYCSRLRKADGLIKDWDKPTDYFLRKHFVFGKPLGTGLYFFFRDIRYEIGFLESIPQFAQSEGISGAVVFIEGQSLWVKTRDSAVQLSGITSNEKPIHVNAVFKIGNRF